MSGFVNETDKAAMVAMGQRWVAEARPIALAEDPSAKDPELTDMRVLMKAFDTLFQAEMDRLSVFQVFGGLGIVLGEIWFQQGAEMRDAISDALSRGMIHGADLAEKALKPRGSA